MKLKSILITAGVAVIAIVGGILMADYLKNNDKNSTETGEEKIGEFISISMEKATEIFKTPGDYIILDVRRADEYAEGHIPGAINVANEEIGSKQPEKLPDLNQVIYVYCRSGRRSKQAAAKLAGIGYTKIYEFGGIMDWAGEIER